MFPFIDDTFSTKLYIVNIRMQKNSFGCFKRNTFAKKSEFLLTKTDLIDLSIQSQSVINNPLSEILTLICKLRLAHPSVELLGFDIRSRGYSQG